MSYSHISSDVNCFSFYVTKQCLVYVEEMVGVFMVLYTGTYHIFAALSTWKFRKRLTEKKERNRGWSMFMIVYARGENGRFSSILHKISHPHLSNNKFCIPSQIFCCLYAYKFHVSPSDIEYKCYIPCLPGKLIPCFPIFPPLTPPPPGPK